MTQRRLSCCDCHLVASEKAELSSGILLPQSRNEM